MILTETSSTVKTTVRYDRSARTWQAINGAVTPTGNGPDGKRAALLLALAHDHPPLAAKINDLSRLHDHDNAMVDRLIKAAQLITHNHVFDGVVRSQTQPDTYYEVRFDGMPRTYKCDCPDDRLSDDHLGEVCKHTLAAHLAYIAGIETPTAPIPDASNLPF